MLKEFETAQHWLEDVLEEKLAKFKQDGKPEREQLALFEVAKSLSIDGCSMELISEVTGLSLADIKCLLD